MKARYLIECMVDPARPVTEIVEVIMAVLKTYPDLDKQKEILNQLDTTLGDIITQLEFSRTTEQP